MGGGGAATGAVPKIEWAVFDRLRPLGGAGASARDIANKTGCWEVGQVARKTGK